MFDELEAHPESGTPLGHNVFKIRLAIAAKGKGKSGSVRVVSYVKTFKSTVLLLSIYVKGDKESISDREIKALLKKRIG